MGQYTENRSIARECVELHGQSYVHRSAFRSRQSVKSRSPSVSSENTKCPHCSTSTALVNHTLHGSGANWFVEGHLNLAGCGQTRTSQSLQVAVSPAPVCQRNVWCEQLHFASCDGLNELEVLAQQIRVSELEQVHALTLQVQQLTGAMVDMDRRHMQEFKQRDLQLAEMRGTLTALNTRGSRLGPGRSELLDPKVLHKVQPFDGQRTSWKKPSSSNGEPTSSLRT